MPTVFLSYRRSDSADVTGRIYDRLVAAFSREAVFKDVDSIPIGTPFPDYLRSALAEAKVVLAVIGPTWLTAADEGGTPRLQHPADFVRIEIETALRLGVPVVPVTVADTVMPGPQDVPVELRELCARNGQPVRPDPDFHRDMDRLESKLRVLLQIPGGRNELSASEERSLMELQRLLIHRARRVEEWFSDRQEDSRSGGVSDELERAISKFRELHGQHIEALRNRDFVLAHEVLNDIHSLLGQHDATRYANTPEYGYKYPGNLDSDDYYRVLKDAPPTIKPQLVKSLFAGMVSREYPVMQGTSSFQFSFLNTGLALAQAVSEQDLAMVQALLDAGFHPDIRVTSREQEPRGENSTPLMFAAYNGNREIARELLDHGADVNAQNERGETALQIALDTGNEDVASLLTALTAKKIATS